jgi:hypothetical protein
VNIPDTELYTHCLRGKVLYEILSRRPPYLSGLLPLGLLLIAVALVYTMEPERLSFLGRMLVLVVALAVTCSFWWTYRYLPYLSRVKCDLLNELPYLVVQKCSGESFSSAEFLQSLRAEAQGEVHRARRALITHIERTLAPLLGREVVLGWDTVPRPCGEVELPELAQCMNDDGVTCRRCTTMYDLLLGNPEEEGYLDLAPRVYAHGEQCYLELTILGEPATMTL